jgi:hypothetical protein
METASSGHRLQPGIDLLMVCCFLLIQCPGAIAGTPGKSGDTTADAVLGQPDFTHTTLNYGGPGAVGGPFGVAVDPAGHLFVADGNRVLGWHSTLALTDGAPADLVIGQTDLFANFCNGNLTGGTSASTLCTVRGVAADSGGNLYVVDAGNSRVLEYDSPFSRFSGSNIVGISANRVFGQGGDFTNSSCNVGTGDGLCAPTGVAVDTTGNVYIADQINNRVLEYNTPLTVTAVPGSGDTIPDLTFGQLSLPYGVAIDPLGNVYISESQNSRVLEYNTPLTVTAVPASGDTVPDRVFGQNGNFNSFGCNKGSTPADISGVGADSL